jgi:CsoR family transcriptional regulator, copper-sensing transcriptional repressor
MKDTPNHNDQLVALKRIEGQVRGLEKMIEEKRYCVDIMTQISSVVGALLRVQDNILDKHMQMCVTTALKGKSEEEKLSKINEILTLIKKFRKNS